MGLYAFLSVSVSTSSVISVLFFKACTIIMSFFDSSSNYSHWIWSQRFVLLPYTELIFSSLLVSPLGGSWWPIWKRKISNKTMSTVLQPPNVEIIPWFSLVSELHSILGWRRTLSHWPSLPNATNKIQGTLMNPQHFSRKVGESPQCWQPVLYWVYYYI